MASLSKTKRGIIQANQEICHTFGNIPYIWISKNTWHLVSRSSIPFTRRQVTKSVYISPDISLHNRRIVFLLLLVLACCPSAFLRAEVTISQEKPVLRDILNKSIATLSSYEVQQAINNHVSIEVSTETDRNLVIRIIVFFSIVLLVGLLWNHQLQRLNRKLARQQARLSSLSDQQKKELHVRQQIESDLRESENKLSGLISSLPGFVYRCANDPHWTMEFISDGCFDITGYKPLDLLGNNSISYGDVVHPDDRQGIWDQWQSCLAAGRQFEGEYRIVRKDSSTRWVWERGHAVYDKSNKLTRLEGFITDITDKKRSEEIIKTAMEQAESANKAKSQFLANMSHEIRTPLNGVIGFTELLKNSQLDDTLRAYANNAFTSAHSLLTIINDILDFSKIEAGKLDVDPVKTDLFELVMHVNDSTRLQTQKKQLTYTVVIEPDTPRYAVFDPVRLKQILTNLLNNAVKFTHEGEIKLIIKFDAIDASKGAFTFQVHDTGIGISKHQQQHLFRAFNQADASTTRKFGGTGLGLAIANSLARIMNSKIELKSEPGKGSTFFFTITTTYENDQESITDQSAPDHNLIESHDHFTFDGSPLIIIAEDVPMNMTLVVSMLRKLIPSAEIVEAINGRQVVEIAKKIKADLILMDIQMPEMDGLEATKLIREMEKSMQVKQAVPIVALTAGVLSEQRDTCLKAGMNDFLAKPVENASMTRILSAFLPHLMKTTEKKSQSANQHTNPDEHFDLKGLADRTGVEEAILQTLAKNAARSLSAHQSALNEAIVLNDADKIKQLAHTIKGVSLNLSFTRLAKMARQMELDIQNEKTVTPHLTQLFSNLQEEIRVVQKVFS
jgi:PAS domain S-box-containing protein